MSDELVRRLCKGIADTDAQQDAADHIEALTAALEKADALEKAIMEDFRKESMETIRDLSLARRAYRAAREAAK